MLMGFMDLAWYLLQIINQNISFVCRDSGYAGFLLIFFSVQVTPAAEHTKKAELQESIPWTTLDTKTLDIRSKV